MLEVQVNEINEVKDEDANVKENGEYVVETERSPYFTDFYPRALTYLCFTISVTPKDLLFNTTTFPALVSQEEIDFYKIMFGSG